MQFYQMLKGSFCLTQMKTVLLPHINIYYKIMSEIVLQHEMLASSIRFLKEVHYCAIQEPLKCLISKIK